MKYFILFLLFCSQICSQDYKVCKSGIPLAPKGKITLRAYPSDPTGDLEWPYSSESLVTDVQTRFNAARANENVQLGTSIPALIFPNQTVWDSMTNAEKALWIINKEREDRGVHRIRGLETNVTGIAQYYAQYLLDNDAFSHDADGRTPWERLNDNPAIGACHDFLSVAENLAVLWGGWTLPIERAIYMWMYDDSGSSWGHRHAILWYPYNDNSGTVGNEGYLGIGMANGTHQGLANSDIIVMNVFDPCSSWIETFVKLVSFKGYVVSNNIILQWTTAVEKDNAGFYIWRSKKKKGPYKKIITFLIPSAGSNHFGADYIFHDEKVKAENIYYYKLEDIDYNGKRTMHKAIKVYLPK